MSKPIGLFYGSTTGNTEDIAEKIAAEIGHDRVKLHDIAAEGTINMQDYQYLIVGIPTWDYGELQEDWSDVWAELDELDLEGINCALFGLGDQIGYGDWFLDAMGALHDKLVSRGARMLGYWSVEGYSFDVSKALTQDQTQFVGLALDEDSQSDQSAERIEKWLPAVLAEFEI
ncbi:MAG: flavodoxin FldB [Amphritea sp.]